MHFDTTELLEALEPPSFKHRLEDGRVLEFKGRHLSLFEWLRHMSGVSKLGKKQLDVLQIEILYVQLMRAWFPRPRRRWLVLPRAHPTADQIFRTLPQAVKQEMIQGFTRSQARALGFPEQEIQRAMTTDTKSPSPATTSSPEAMTS